jgi:hypothetical protein
MDEQAKTRTPRSRCEKGYHLAHPQDARNALHGEFSQSLWQAPLPQRASRCAPKRHVSLLAAIQQHLDLALFVQIPSWVKLRGVVTKYSQIEVDHVHAQESMSIPPLGMNMQSSAEAARGTPKGTGPVLTIGQI